VTPQREFRRSDFEKAIGEEEADSLRLLFEVGGHGAFVAAFRDRAEIVHAHVNRQSPQSAALASAGDAQGSLAPPLWQGAICLLRRAEDGD
jgi:hypothetical protein